MLPDLVISKAWEGKLAVVWARTTQPSKSLRASIPGKGREDLALEGSGCS
jgi:hypothetical protein